MSYSPVTLISDPLKGPRSKEHFSHDEIAGMIALKLRRSYTMERDEAERLAKDALKPWDPQQEGMQPVQAEGVFKEI